MSAVLALALRYCPAHPHLAIFSLTPPSSSRRHLLHPHLAVSFLPSHSLRDAVDSDLSLLSPSALSHRGIAAGRTPVMVQPPRSHRRGPVSPAPGPHRRSRFTRAGLGGGRPERPQCTPVTVVPPRRHFSVRPAPTPRHGERLRLRLRLRLQLRGWRRGGEAGPGAHHGAGEGADRRGQRSGALAAHDGQVLSEVHREAWRSPGQLGAEVHRHVHGPLHGRLEHGFPSLQLAAAEGESQHVRSRRSWSRAGPCGPGRSGGCGGTLRPCQPGPWQSNNP